MPRLAAILIAPLPLLVGGCCCCNPLSWVPDDLLESAVTEGARFGFEQMTGVRVEGDGDRFTVSTPEGRFVVAQGVRALDPRVPVAPYPNCAIAGGISGETDDQLSTGFVQQECSTGIDGMAEHFERQIRALGAEPQRTGGRHGASGGIKLLAEGDGTRFKQIAILLQEDLGPPLVSNAIVTVQLAR